MELCEFDELMAIPEIAKRLQDGEKQVQAYGQKFEKRYKNLWLQKFAIDYKAQIP